MRWAALVAIVATSVVTSWLFLAPNRGLDAPAQASGGGPEMRLAVKDGTCADGTCVFGQGERFVLSVEIVTLPASGYYVGAQTFVEFGHNLVYEPSKEAEDEVVWDDCEGAIAARGHPSSSSVSHWCLELSAAPSSYVGDFVNLLFRCTLRETSTEVRLLELDHPDAGNSGAAFLLGSGEIVAAKGSSLTIKCGGPALTSPTPTGLAGPTPRPTRQPITGDVNCDKSVDSIDAVLVLQLVAGLVPSLACRLESDTNDDGVTDAVDALLILQSSARLVSLD